MSPRSSKDDATTLHGTARLPDLHGRNPPLRHHLISHNTYGEPRSFPCSSPDLANRPWHSTPGACRPRPSPASGYTRTHVHTRDHAVTTPPAPCSSPACLAVVTMSPWPPGSPYRPHGNLKPRLEPWTPSPCPHGSTEAFTCPAEPSGSLHTRPHRRQAPPFTVAIALVSPGRHLDPTIAVVETWQYFSPRQLGASAAAEACR
jgi:hypothetical protein